MVSKSSYLFLTLLFALFHFGCTKKIEVEKIIYKGQPDIRTVKYPPDSFNLNLRTHGIPSNPKDTSIFREIDINSDMINDIRCGVELYHVDTEIYIKVFVKRLNNGLQLLGYDESYGRALTSFSDTNNYITPNQDQWKSADMTDEYLISISNREKCIIDGMLSLCIIEQYGNFIDKKNRYFFGFRIKDSKSNGQSTYWHYGFFKIQVNGALLVIDKMAIENTVDKPILLME